MHKAAIANPDIDKGRNWLAYASIVFFIAVLLVVTWARIRLIQLPLERDEGEYAYMGQLLLQGKAPYNLAYTMKFPGVFTFYALFMLVLGQTVAALRSGILLINLASAINMYLLGRRLFSPAAGAIAGSAFAVLSIGRNVLGLFGHATQFVVFFVLVGLLLTEYALRRERSWFLFASGIAFGFAYTMKQHGIAFAAVPLLWIILNRRGRDAPAIFRNIARFAAGLMLPLILVLLLVAISGSFDAFRFWTFDYARAYASGVPAAQALAVFRSQFSDVVSHTSILWCMGATGLILLAAPGTDSKLRIVILTLSLCAVVAILPGFHFRPHYFILLLPPLCILIAMTVTRLPLLLPQAISGLAQVALFVIFAGGIVKSLTDEKDLLFQLPPVQVMKKTFVTTKPFADAMQVARYIASNSGPDDTILILGSEPEIFFYARRHSATPYIYVYSLVEPQPYAESMRNEMMRVIERAKPSFVVVVNDMSSWLTQTDDAGRFFNSMNRYLAGSYLPVGWVDIHWDKDSVYVWGKDAAAFTPASNSSMLVLQRKN